MASTLIETEFGGTPMLVSAALHDAWLLVAIAVQGSTSGLR